MYKIFFLTIKNKKMKKLFSILTLVFLLGLESFGQAAGSSLYKRKLVFFSQESKSLYKGKETQVFNLLGMPFPLEKALEQGGLYIYLEKNSSFLTDSFFRKDSTHQYASLVMHCSECDSLNQNGVSILNELTQYVDTTIPIYQSSYFLRENKKLFDSAYFRANNLALFDCVPFGDDWNPITRNPVIDLQNAFKSIPRKKRTTIDSIAIVVNYVYDIMVYSTEGQGNNPFVSYDSSITTQINAYTQNPIFGLCSEYANLTSKIIWQMFPWWGTPIELTSQKSDLQGNHLEPYHVFVGLSDSFGKVIAILDPTINIVWCKKGKKELISLNEMENNLQTKNKKIGKYESSFFTETGKVLNNIGKQNCYPFFLESNNLTAHAWANKGIIIFSGEESSKIDAPSWTRFYDWAYYKYKGYPQMTWANCVLNINQGTCIDPIIGQKIAQKYGWTIYTP